MGDSLYSFCKVVGKSFGLVCQIEVSGAEHVPTTGPCLLVANHISHFDPPLISSAIARPIDYLTAAEFFSNPLFRFFLRRLNAFPIDRGGIDLKAVKTSLSRLKRNRIVGVFPEGGIRHGATSVLNGAPLPASFVSLAQSARAPIIPFVIVGADQLYQLRNWLRRPRLFLHCGKPIEYTAKDDRQELATLVATRLRELYEEIRREHSLRREEEPHSAQERWAAK